MKKLFLVDVDVEIQSNLTIPVFAESKNDADSVAMESFSINDCDLDISYFPRIPKKLPEWCRDDIPEGEIEGRTCDEIFNEIQKQERIYQAEESGPKLPGF